MNTNTQHTNKYKNSPLGLIPEDWEVKKFKEILEEGKLGGNYENSESNEGVPVMKMGNLGRGVMNLNKIQYLPENEKYNKDDVLKEGDLLFNTRNTLDLVGKVSIWRNELPFSLYNSNLMRMKFSEKNVGSNDFMNSAFNAHYILSQLRGIATGTTSVAAIYGKDLNKVKFILPLIPEQKAIADCLSTWDKAIGKQNTLIAQKELAKKALMQQLLSGKKRLKGFSGEWKEVRMGEVTKNFSRRNKDLNGARIYSVTNTNGFVFQSDHFAREVAGDDLTNYKIIKKNEFAYNPARINVGSIAFFTDDIGVISSLYVCFSTTDQVLDYFLEQILKLDHTKHRIESHGEGGVRIYLWYELFSKIKIKIPSIEEQTEIARILQCADDELQLLKKKLDQLKEQKKGLMQVLLTGKKRLRY
jgi:type I restriction enzyme S subunit